MKRIIIILATVSFAGYVGYTTRDYQGKNWKGVGVLSMSRNITDAKEKGVYLWSYSPPENPYLVNDTLSIHVKEAWLEKTFRKPAYGNGANLRNSSSYQIVMTLADREGNYFDLPYSISSPGNKYYLSKSSILFIGILDQIPLSDTLTFPVQSGNEYFDKEKANVVGSFKLVRDSLFDTHYYQ